jgi:putative endonuclease
MFHVGQIWERRGQRFLEQQGLQLLARNVRCNRGELDLVMLDGNHLVFVEVRYRRPSRFSTAAASISHQKQVRLVRAAESFLCHHPNWQDHPCRFDVIAYDSPDQHDNPLWLRGVFA